MQRVGRPPTPEYKRFWSKVRLDESGCWLWMGCKTHDGYARFRVKVKNKHGQVLGHRWMYQHAIGEIPEGLTLDHLCRVRHCVHPGHLEPVAMEVNWERGEGWMGRAHPNFKH